MQRGMMTSQKSAVADGREFLVEDRMFGRLFRGFRTGDGSGDYSEAVQYNEEMDPPDVNSGKHSFSCFTFTYQVADP